MAGGERAFTVFVAVTVTRVAEVTFGAVNSPPLEIAPALAVQTTAVLLVDVRVATNCCRAPEETVTVEGETLILMLELFETEVWPGADDEMPEQPVDIQATAKRSSPTPNVLR